MEGLGRDEFEVQLGVCRPNEVEVLGGHSRDEELPIQGRLVVVEDEEEQANNVFHDSLTLEVGGRSLQVALQEVEQDSQQVDVVFAVLELLHDLSDQDDHQLRDPIQVTLPQVCVHLDLAVEGVEADVDQALDLELAKEVTQGPVLRRGLPNCVAGVCVMRAAPLGALILPFVRHDGLRPHDGARRIEGLPVAGAIWLPVGVFRRGLLLQLFICVDDESQPVRDLGLHLFLVVVRLMAEHRLEDDVFGARGYV